MQSGAARIGVLVAVVAVAVLLFIVFDSSGGGGGSTSSGTQVLTVNDGNPVGGVKTLTYSKGDQVNLEIRLNTPERAVHVHGYEIEKPAKTSPVRFSFPANLDGVFEIEVHRTGGSDVQIAELKVNP